MVCQVVSDLSVRWKYTQPRGRNFITVRRNLRTESSHLSSHFYNSVRSAETLLGREARVSSTMRTTWGIPPDLKCEANHSKVGQSVFRREGDVTVWERTDKRLMWMKSVIRDTTVVNAARKENRLGNKETLCCFSVQSIHEGRRQGRQVLQLSLRSEENCQMT